MPKSRRRKGVNKSPPPGAQAGNKALQAARTHLAKGDLARAKIAYRAILETRPDCFDALYLLGIAHAQEGAPEKAVALLKQALSHNPRSAEAHYDLGNMLMRLGRSEEATTHYRQALAIRPDYPEAHNNLGLVLRQQEKFDEAATHFRRALAIRPDYAEAHYNFGLVRAHQSRFDEAATHYRQALAIRPNYAESHCSLGAWDFFHGRFEDAATHYIRALEIKPEYADAHFKFGLLLYDQGRFDEAATHYRQALALDPDLAGAFLGLVVTKQTIPEPIVVAARAKAADADYDDDNLIHLHFALAKIDQDDEAYDQAFVNYRQANAIRYRNSKFDPARWTSHIDDIIECHSPAFFEARRDFGRRSERPVFVVGMPRSGTTLVEQILASHPLCHGAGELSDLGDIAQSLPAAVGTDTPYPHCAAAIDRATALKIADAQVARLQDLAPGAARVVDKQPFNVLYLGLITLLLPQAAIIHCRRDPMDTCLSCFFQDFSSLEFTSDLHNLGVVYRSSERLMDHWKAVLPRPMLEVEYEALIDDQEAVTKRIIDFVGLAWDERCLSFHKTDRPIRTASAWQARQPIYRTSVGRWRHYEAHLEPLKTALGIE